MDEIIIPFDINSLNAVVKRQANDFCYGKLTVVTMFLSGRDAENREAAIKRLKSKLREYINKSDKVTFISEVLIYLGDLKDNEEISIDLDATQLVQDMQHALVRELEKMDIGIDKNAFSNQEILGLNKKINKIIDKLEEISGGQEVIFERIEELKNDYEDLMKSYGLGKKPFLQRFAGIVASYTGEKGADTVFDHLKPLIKEVLENAPRMIENL